ncbi:MAG TPA: STAS domain-containing protein [Herpetosiphonaceae bacterium]
MPTDEAYAFLNQQVLHALQTADVHGSTLSAEQLQDAATRIVQQFYAFRDQPNTAEARSLGARLAEQGLSLQAFIRAGRVLRADAANNGAPDNADARWELVSAVLEGYVDETRRAAQEATIAEIRATQRREDQLRAVIQELSTPIIPIYRGVLVLPLVGAIDSLRSQEITEKLLEEIVRQQADMVIIDITGVSVVDTSVANHLIMTAQAVNLLGSRVIFTGISSTIAQTIIQLGVNLGDVVTLNNLQAGMLYALQQLGLGITELASV